MCANAISGVVKTNLVMIKKKVELCFLSCNADTFLLYELEISTQCYMFVVFVYLCKGRR